jgi:hypothetical protein
MDLLIFIHYLWQPIFVTDASSRFEFQRICRLCSFVCEGYTSFRVKKVVAAPCLCLPDIRGWHMAHPSAQGSKATEILQ